MMPRAEGVWREVEARRKREKGVNDAGRDGCDFIASATDIFIIHMHMSIDDMYRDARSCVRCRPHKCECEIRPFASSSVALVPSSSPRVARTHSGMRTRYKCIRCTREGDLKARVDEGGVRDELREERDENA
jgi:hypothetical protein